MSSLGCGLAQNLPEFIAARAVQGLGSALMTPVGRVLVLRNASKSELLSATALITWPALFAPVIGPVLGGFITTYLDLALELLPQSPARISRGLARPEIRPRLAAKPRDRRSIGSASCSLRPVWRVCSGAFSAWPQPDNVYAQTIALVSRG